MFFDQAIERAQYLDDYLRREGRVIGPLHGLPISVKVCLPLERHICIYVNISTHLG
jgi:amidase